MLAKVVAPNQCSFVPGRLSSDNIIVAQEVIHSMRKMTGRKGFMAIKIDLEKAYDRIKWSFVVQCLKELKIPEPLVQLIECCISSSSMQILWNGSKAESFIPSRGIRQGDPLSPYLFVLCMEKLAHLILEEMVKGNWEPIRLSKMGPPISHLFFADDLIIFAKANLSQVEVIKKCLNVFCESSGQRVSLAKTRVFFSHNVNHNVRAQLSEELGFTPTADLGKYLGVPLHHECVKKETYQFVVDRVRKRLSNWKVNSLSFAGRHTLVKTVISAAPNHVMQTALLPSSCCDELDKSTRSFLWGSTTVKKKAHLVAWDHVCSKKEVGGLGLRHTRIQNQAFLMKLGWGLVTNRQALWVKVMRGKYRCGDDLIPKIEGKRNGSRAWNGIKMVWERTRAGMEVVNRNGRECVRWKYERSGVFSVSSAYSVLANETIHGSSTWSKIWKLKIPQRCKSHLWLFLHDRLLTNAAKYRRGLHDTGRCDLCGLEETGLHVSRDCAHVREVWEKLGISLMNFRFWNSDLSEWVSLNIKDSRNVENGRWCDLFGIVCWLVWKRRNERVHQQSSERPLSCLPEAFGVLGCMNKFSLIVGGRGTSKGQAKHGNDADDAREEWTSVFIDGAFSHVSGSVGCGGVMKEASGVIKEAFMFRPLEGDNTTGEIWGCLIGLRRAWDHGIRKVTIFCDSSEVVRLLNSEVPELHMDRDLILETQRLINREWRVRLLVIARDANRAVDLFAKKALAQGYGLQVVSGAIACGFLHEDGIT